MIAKARVSAIKYRNLHSRDKEITPLQVNVADKEILREMAEEGRRVRSQKYTRKLSNMRDRCENIDLNPSNEKKPVKVVKYEGRGSGVVERTQRVG